MTDPDESFGELGEEILRRLAGRYTEEDQEDLALYAWEEEGIFADWLVGDLIRRQIPISGAEYELIVRLLGYFSLPSAYLDRHHPYIVNRDRSLAALNVVDQP